MGNIIIQYPTAADGVDSISIVGNDITTEILEAYSMAVVTIIVGWY